MATKHKDEQSRCTTKKARLIDPNTYWKYLENLKIEGKPHCMID